MGLNLASLPGPALALRSALESGSVAATAPLNLVQLPGIPAVVAYVPVLQGEEESLSATGFVGFSFVLEKLLKPVLDDDMTIKVRDITTEETVDVYAQGMWNDSVAHIQRDVRFGGRLWSLDIQEPADFGQAARQRGYIVAAISLLFVIGAMSILGFVLSLNRRLRHAEERLSVVNDELTHRLKNVFAVSQSLASQTFKSVDPTGVARQAFADRMASLAQGATLLAQRGSSGADLAELIRALQLPLNEQVRLDGPAVRVGPNAAQSLTLLFHELWTNACKHGALSGGDGHVLVSWRLEGDVLRLAWTEDAGVRPDLTQAQGFGRTLIERIVPMQLAASAEVISGEAGLQYELRMPISRSPTKATFRGLLDAEGVSSGPQRFLLCEDAIGFEVSPILPPLHPGPVSTASAADAEIGAMG